MPLFTYLRTALGGHIFRGVPYTAPTTIYIGLHTATTTAAAATQGATTISVANLVAINAGIVIDPVGGQPHSYTVTGVAGGGPYTLTLNTALTAAVGNGVAVSFDPNPSGSTLKPPVGGAYARAAVAANLTNWSATIDNLVVITYPQATATWGLLTHVTSHDALTGGVNIMWGAFTTPVMVNAGQTFSFAVGDLDVLFT